MKFTVKSSVIVCNLLDGEIRARLASRKNPDRMRAYRQKGIIDSSKALTQFMVKYPNVFANKKLINANGNNFFSEILSISSLAGTENYKDKLKSRMEYEYNLSEKELEKMDQFIEDLERLDEEPEIQQIVKKTISYKNSVERVWKENEASIMKYIKGVLYYEPEIIGKVNTYIMFPNFDTHRSCQFSNDKTILFFGKRNGSDINKTLAYLTHQAVHQPIFPYKPFMTKKQKEEFHAFIKFLTDKDVYNYLSGKSYLDIVTENENPEVMGKVYPFWLGYRYRNVDKKGLSPDREIGKAIKRDYEYYKALPNDSKKKSLYKYYNFKKLDPLKIASFFREKRSMTPYEFAQINFDDKKYVYSDEYLSDAPNR